VVVDDGSGPDHEARYREICAAHDRVRLIRNPASVGNPGSRNVGLEHVRGRLFTTLDDDDELLPGRLAAQVEVLERFGFPGDLIALTGVEQVWSDGRTAVARPSLPSPTRLDVPGDPFGTIGIRVFLDTYLVPADLMRAAGGYDDVLRWGEHTDLYLRLQREARFVAVPMIGTRVHHDAARGQMSRDWDRKVIGITRILDKHAAVFDAAPKLKATWLDGLGMAQLRTGHRSDAARTFRRAIRAYPRRLRVWRHLLAAATHTERVLCRPSAGTVGA
jgi:glycosyltransferase involved in cell wall biosynthesis